MLDLVDESNAVEIPKSTVISCLPSRKRSKISVDVTSHDVLIMPEPNIDHQVNKLKLN